MINRSGDAKAAMRTDLAAELDLSDREGIEERHENASGIDISTIKIVSEGAEKRLGKQLYPKHLRGKLAYGGIGREHGEQQRAYEHHYQPQYAHYGCAHANAYVAIAAGKLILARAHAAAYDRCGSGAYSVAGHVA